LARSLRDRILEVLKKEALNPSEIASRTWLPQQYVRYILPKLKIEGLVEYDLATEKWHLKRR